MICRRIWLLSVALFLAWTADVHAQVLPNQKIDLNPAAKLPSPFDDQPKQPEPQDEFAANTAPEGTSETSTAVNPHMIGDFGGSFAMQIIRIRDRQGIRGEEIVVAVPTALRGGVKMAENASPRPVDRVYGYYRNFNNLQSPFGLSPQYDLSDKVFGFEKTFWNGNASLEMRLPFYDLNGLGGGSGIGDLGIIFKYALYNNRATGDVFSTGLMLTTPTGNFPDNFVGGVHSTLFQPFIGYIVNSNRFFVQGFSSVIIPSDRRDLQLVFNDIGVGYQLYRAPSYRFISAIVPAVEAHITNPLGNSNTVIVPDLLVITGGVHIQFSGRAVLSIAGATPVAGPQVYDFESMIQFNYQF